MNNYQSAPDDSSLELPPDTSVVAQDSPAANPLLHHRWHWALLAVALLALGAIILAGLAWQQSHAKKAAPAKISITTQSLDNGTLTKLANQAGSSATKQLVVTPDTNYKNSVSVNQSLQVSGQSTLQGSTSINGNLAVRGSLSVGGQLSAGSLNVGTLNTTSINSSGNLIFAGHVVSGGPVPSGRASVASSGGSIHTDGTDTAGTVTITTGGSPTVGELAIINFARAYAIAPKMSLTPLNSASAELNYYLSPAAGFFTINAATQPAPNTTYSFDYTVSQ